MGEITIANIRDLGPPAEWEPWQVYVGRKVGRRGLKRSPLANPFRIGRLACDEVPWASRTHATFRLSREDVIESYQTWLEYAAPLETGLVKAELAHLRALLASHGRLTLVCWCAPKPCHAEVVRDWLLQGQNP